MDIDKSIVKIQMSSFLAASGSIVGAPPLYHCHTLSDSESVYTTCCLCFKSVERQYLVMSIRKGRLCIGGTPCTLVEQVGEVGSVENRKVCAPCYRQNQRDYKRGMVGLGFARVRANSLRLAQQIRPNTASSSAMDLTNSCSKNDSSTSPPIQIDLDESSPAVHQFVQQIQPLTIASELDATNCPPEKEKYAKQRSDQLASLQRLEEFCRIKSENDRLKNELSCLRQQTIIPQHSPTVCTRNERGDLHKVEIEQHIIQVVTTRLPTTDLVKYSSSRALEPTLYHWNDAENKFEALWCRLDLKRLLAVDATASIETQTIAFLLGSVDNEIFQ